LLISFKEKIGDQMSYIKGINRNQTLLFPEVIEDYIDEDNPVRFIDAYVDNLDLVVLEFKYAIEAETGRPPYNPGDILKLYIYGYLNSIRSSRRLEQETHRNIEVVWLLKKLHPDFKTIADFRRDNKKAIKRVYREFTLLCK
jgi:transposase